MRTEYGNHAGLQARPLVRVVNCYLNLRRPGLRFSAALRLSHGGHLPQNAMSAGGRIYAAGFPAGTEAWNAPAVPPFRPPQAGKSPRPPAARPAREPAFKAPPRSSPPAPHTTALPLPGPGTAPPPVRRTCGDAARRCTAASGGRLPDAPWKHAGAGSP